MYRYQYPVIFYLESIRNVLRSPVDERLTRLILKK